LDNKRRPVSKNCRFCGKFMTLAWAEAGSKAVERIDCLGYSLVPIFYCPDCNENDNVMVDPEDYQWLIFRDTIDFEAAKQELSPKEYFFLLLDYKRMERRFKNRPYLAIPELV
jgi:hypothetical protein